MWLRVQFGHIVVDPANHGILAGGQLVQLRILERKIALPHRAFYSFDGMAHHASQAGPRFGSIYDLLDRRIKHSAVQQRRIVAAGAPF